MAKLQHIEKYYNKCLGETCFLLGNGTSLNRYNTADLDPNSCMTMNRSWKVVPGAMWHINCMDITSVRKQPQHILYLGSDGSVGRAVLERVKSLVIAIEPRFLGIRLRPYQSSFSIEPKLDLRLGWGMTHAGILAIHVAWWLGYRKLYLLGYDGYAGHFTTKDRNMIPNHSKHTKEMSRFLALLHSSQAIKIYNCNADNIYGHEFKPFEECHV